MSVLCSLKSVVHDSGIQRNRPFRRQSLSATDYIGHAFGPESLEYQDNLIRLDCNLADFLAFLDKTIGKDRILVVLSADHGVADIPENAHDAGFDADRFYPKKVRAYLNEWFKARFHATDNLIAAFSPPGLYLMPDTAIAPREAIETALAQEARKIPGVGEAYTRTQILNGRLPNTELGRRITRSYHPTRSGDVIIIQKQFWYLYHDPECCAAMHGSRVSIGLTTRDVTTDCTRL
jgi:Type I phosphodiesterase / nucleotide pyrophosphatase